MRVGGKKGPFPPPDFVTRELFPPSNFSTPDVFTTNFQIVILQGNYFSGGGGAPLATSLLCKKCGRLAFATTLSWRTGWLKGVAAAGRGVAAAGRVAHSGTK